MKKERNVWVGCLALLLMVAISSVGLFALGGDDIPDFRTVRGVYSASESWLCDRHGEVIHVLRTDPEGRRLAWAALPSVSPSLVRGVIAAEDRRFYRHVGVDPFALAAALRDRVVAGRRRGGSTITMQLAGMLVPEGRPRRVRRTVWEKARQMRTALRIERSWTKSEILEAYLNLASFRGEIRGIAAAARGLFDKDPAGLDVAESAVLAVLLPSTGSSPERVGLRAARLARRLGTDISETAVRILAERLGTPGRVRPETALAPHAARMLLRRPNERIVSTLDGRLQRHAADTLDRRLGELRGRNVRDGAVLVADNRSGDVLAYVGNRGSAASSPAVDGIRAVRQAGSSLKPLLYALALEKRYLTAASLVDDAPLQLATPRGLYAPENFDRAYAGPVTVRTALASSLNMPAVRTLLITGVDSFVGRLREAGFAGIREIPDFYGHSLALGAADVSLWELVNAYRAFANGGRWSPLRFRREDPSGFRRIMDDGAAFIVASILADREARSATFGLESALSTRYWSAVKTGTSKDMRDNWCVGFSERFTVGVWIGNFNGEPMWNVTGVAGAAPVWREIMDSLHEGVSSMPPAPPAGVREYAVRFAGPGEAPRREWFIRGTEPDGPVCPAGTAARPRISSPVPGTIVALDGDIPEDHQRVLFARLPEGIPCRWFLDGQEIGESGDLLWRPLPGRHRLTLADSAGRLLDAVRFDVR